MNIEIPKEAKKVVIIFENWHTKKDAEFAIAYFMSKGFEPEAPKEPGKIFFNIPGTEKFQPKIYINQEIRLMFFKNGINIDFE